MLIDTLHDEALKIVFRFLNERDRIRFMVSNKKFAHLLAERRKAAAEALECLRETYSMLEFKWVVEREKGVEVLYHTYKVRLYRGDPDIKVWGDLGLMHVAVSKHVRPYPPFDSIRFFSPWSRSFVHQKISDDERIDADEDQTSLHSTLTRISKRIV